MDVTRSKFAVAVTGIGVTTKELMKLFE